MTEELQRQEFQITTLNKRKKTHFNFKCEPLKFNSLDMNWGAILQSRCCSSTGMFYQMHIENNYSIYPLNPPSATLSGNYFNYQKIKTILRTTTAN